MSTIEQRTSNEHDGEVNPVYHGYHHPLARVLDHVVAGNADPALVAPEFIYDPESGHLAWNPSPETRAAFVELGSTALDPLTDSDSEPATTVAEVS